MDGSPIVLLSLVTLLCVLLFAFWQLNSVKRSKERHGEKMGEPIGPADPPADRPL